MKMGAILHVFGGGGFKNSRSHFGGNLGVDSVGVLHSKSISTAIFQLAVIFELSEPKICLKNGQSIEVP